MNVKNVFSGIPALLPEELFEEILHGRGFRLERIVSRGHASPPGFWYDQEESEWVILLQGSAGLRLEGVEKVIALGPGNHLVIPAHQKHRVEWTDPDQDTIWLGLHF